MIKFGSCLRGLSRSSVVGVVVAMNCAAINPVYAVPSFAQQTGQACQACHVGGFGPQLTLFGREFKLRGYTMRANKFNPPVSAMAVASFTNTKHDQASPPADGFGVNNNFAFDQGSVFLAGGVGTHFGGFVQTTYNGISKSWNWDNADFRLVNAGQIGGKEIVYGLTLNNNPTVQDVWNTTPAWGFPYTSSALAPTPGTAPLLDGALAQNVVGLSSYAWIDSKLYLELGAYSTPSAGTLNWLGVDPASPGDIHGLAPYARVAYQRPVSGGTLEVGAFALKAGLWPGRDRSVGVTDHYSDVGLDASWIKPMGARDTLTINARYVHEQQSLTASCAIGLANGSISGVPLPACADSSLDELRADASYYWHNKIGATVGAFSVTGSANPTQYAVNAALKPDSSGITLQIDGTPFGDAKSPLGPRFNLRVGAQYTAYTSFNGSRHNYDGAGANASDNNSLRVFTWIAF